MPQLFDPERCLADSRDLGPQLLAAEPDQIAAAVRQHVGRRVEQGRFGQHALALGLRQLGHGAGRERVHTGQALFSSA